MSFKSLIQFLILVLIILIIGSVYLNYFDAKKNVIEETDLIEKNNKHQIKELEKKISNLELKNIELNKKFEDNSNTISNVKSENFSKNNINEKKVEEVKNTNILKKAEVKNTNILKEAEVKNLVKDIEYTSVDQKGNKFFLLATSGKSNMNNNDILDLKDVRGKITSDIRDTIYIVSDFGQYNSVNLNSKFYKNVVINYQDKEITCINFDINMETSKAIAYNNVLITDPKSTMKAGIVEFDLKTKNININPESSTEEIEVVTN